MVLFEIYLLFEDIIAISEHFLFVFESLPGWKKVKSSLIAVAFALEPTGPVLLAGVSQPFATAL